MIKEKNKEKSKLAAEAELSNSKSKTYSRATHSTEEIIRENISNYCKKFDLNINEIHKSPLIMYWLPKMHKTLIGVRFIVASKNYSAKPLSDTISKIFKLIFNTLENFHNKSFFYSSCKKFWVVQNSFPIVAENQCQEKS